MISVVSVTENGEALADTVDFRVDAEAGQLVRLNEQTYPTAWRAWPLAVTYRGGFETIPPDVQDAVIRLVKARWIGRGRDPF